MKREMGLFFSALTFYTRLPAPKKFQGSSLHTTGPNNAIRYLPLIGWLTGAAAGAVYVLAGMLFSYNLAIIGAMLVTVLITGAFHEDGFADVCDGFGGGWAKDKILLIMKDSRLGTYGVTGLVFMLAIKFLLLSELLTLPWVRPHKLLIILIFIVGHALSRFAAMSLVFKLDYVRTAQSKSADATLGSYNKINLYIGAVFAFIPLVALVFAGQKYALILTVLPVFMVIFYAARYFKKWINGYTGDCLGAVQQLAEVTLYLAMILVWKFT